MLLICSLFWYLGFLRRRVAYSWYTPKLHLLRFVADLQHSFCTNVHDKSKQWSLRLGWVYCRLLVVQHCECTSTVRTAVQQRIEYSPFRRRLGPAAGVRLWIITAQIDLISQSVTGRVVRSSTLTVSTSSTLTSSRHCQRPATRTARLAQYHRQIGYRVPT